MQSISISARQARRHYRHELRTLTYVTLDQANGGIVRNLNAEGIAVQAVGALRQDQCVRLRFELRFPRLRVETYGQVTWANSSGQCGIRFVDLPKPAARLIQQWIFANLLETAGIEPSPSKPIFPNSPDWIAVKEKFAEPNGRPHEDSEPNIALIRSTFAASAIPLQPLSGLKGEQPLLHRADLIANANAHFAARNRLWQPISSRTLAQLVDGLVVTAALLLFALIFLSIAHELPRWPLTLAAAAVVTAFVVATYRILFAVFGGQSAGARLMQAPLVQKHNEELAAVDHFR